MHVFSTRAYTAIQIHARYRTSLKIPHHSLMKFNSFESLSLPVVRVLQPALQLVVVCAASMLEVCAI
jgi:hypothetical protein